MGGRATAPSARAGDRWSLGSGEAAIEARLASWTTAGVAGRVWQKDPALWPQAPRADVEGRLGWLRAPEQSSARVRELREFADTARDEGIQHVVLLGMGGSSLAAEVIAGTLPHGESRPTFSVLDSSHPAAVRACEERNPPAKTLYLVSSKSGTTLEPNAFFRYFWERVVRSSTTPGRQFVAITDPGTPLERLASDRRFRACFSAPPDVGGRYSALTVFGLVPAALLGVDLEGLLRTARTMVARCLDAGDARTNPGLRLGATLGELGRAGRDKVVFYTSPSLAAFPAWAEQLIAESLGKLGRGLVPVADTPPEAEFPEGSDVVCVELALSGDRERSGALELTAREAAGIPVVRVSLGSPLDLGQEFFRWEFAVAVCGSVLEVDPFDQPDVERAKELARQAMGPTDAPPRAGEAAPVRIGPGLGPSVERWLGKARPRDYVAVQAFLAPNEAADRELRQLASALRRRLGLVVTVGYGPRFLHSTGQLHKGGPPSGLFLQLVDEPQRDLEVPELGLTFGRIVRAQARGDRTALEEEGRRVLAVNLGPRTADGLDALATLVRPPAPAAGGPA
jgi:transaldolase / glucose-6-phosphate isomerase